MYPGHNEDFAGSNPSQLDTWVFDQVTVSLTDVHTYKGHFTFATYAQIPLRRLSPKLFRGESHGHESWKSRTQTVTNHETVKFRWKSPTQITKVADTNHLNMSRCLRHSPWQVHNKSICVALMEFSPLYTMHGESPRQSLGQVHDKVADLSRTQIMKVSDAICVADFHDLCRRLSWFVSTTL